MSKRFIRIREACRIFGVGRSTLYHRIKTDPHFPKPVKILGPARSPPALSIRRLPSTRPLALPNAMRLRP